MYWSGFPLCCWGLTSSGGSSGHQTIKQVARLTRSAARKYEREGVRDLKVSRGWLSAVSSRRSSLLCGVSATVSWNEATATVLFDAIFGQWHEHHGIRLAFCCAVVKNERANGPQAFRPARQEPSHPKYSQTWERTFFVCASLLARPRYRDRPAPTGFRLPDWGMAFNALIFVRRASARWSFVVSGFFSTEANFLFGDYSRRGWNGWVRLNGTREVDGKLLPSAPNVVPKLVQVRSCKEIRNLRIYYVYSMYRRFIDSFIGDMLVCLSTYCCPFLLN